LILVFVLLLTLVFGCAKRPQGRDEAGIGASPSLDLFESGTPTYDVSAIVKDGATSEDRKATDLLIQTAYNQINIERYYYSARVDVYAGKNTAFSDYNYTRNGLNTFKRAQAYTGTFNTYVLRSYYIDQRIEETGLSDYDDETNVWSYTSTLKHKKEDRTLKKDNESPYLLYSVLDLPLDFGGEKRANEEDATPRSSAIDYTLIDPDSVTLTEAKNDERESYYVLTFKMRTDKMNDSEEMKYRLSDTTAGGRMKNIRFDAFTVTAEIWKDSGVFRTLSYQANVYAKISGKSGDAEIVKSMKFSYDEENCSVAKKIKSVTNGKGDATFYNDLKPENQAKCDAEIAALAIKKAADKAEQ